MNCVLGPTYLCCLLFISKLNTCTFTCNFMVIKFLIDFNTAKEGPVAYV